MGEALLDELLEEIFLVLPPDKPETLRAAAVCRRWCRVISTPDFHRRFAQRHRTPPMLGFFANVRVAIGRGSDSSFVARFIGTTSFRPTFHPPRGEHLGRRAIDARHGRLLLTKRSWGSDPLGSGPPHGCGAWACRDAGECALRLRGGGLRRPWHVRPPQLPPWSLPHRRPKYPCARLLIGDCRMDQAGIYRCPCWECTLFPNQ